VPLICCNMALLTHIETQASRQLWAPAIRASVITGLGYLLCLIGFAALREFLISGQLGHNWQLLIPRGVTGITGTFEATTNDLFRFVSMTPIALILLGLILALRNLLSGEPELYNDQNPASPVNRARVTGKIQAS